MDRATFVQDLIGRPYRLGAQGPAEFDCWSLTRHVQSALFGRDLAVVEVPEGADIALVRWMMAAHAERRRWSEIAVPEDGCIVTTTQGVERTHTGTWLDLDRGAVLHTLPECGASFDHLTDLQGAGWGRFRFWRPSV